MIDVEQARALAAQAVEATRRAGADGSEAIAFAADHALTRFANNRIHQNVATVDTEMSVRAVIGTQIGVASTNRVDAEGLDACCRAAVEAARHAPADPFFPGLPGPRPVETIDRVAAATLGFDADLRAKAVEEIVGESKALGCHAAGGVACTHSVTAIANSLGVDVAMPRTHVRATVLSTGLEGGTGWSSFMGADASRMLPAAMGWEAAEVAVKAAHAGDLDPGEYTVVLAPEAVADLALFIGWFGCSAKTVEEGRSFMSGKIGQRFTSANITLLDNALSPEAAGLTFDYEGQPKTRTMLIDEGIAVGPVTDSYWAARTGRPDTGHALPAPNAEGPLPLDIEMLAGDADAKDMIESVKSGIYVTRFHYVNVADPTRMVLTGMTRDGTFFIRNGELTTPVKDLRFTQNALEALATTSAVSKERKLVGEEGTALVPYLLLDRFSFTGQTE